MLKPRYGFFLGESNAEEAEQQLEAQDLDFQEEFDFFVEKTSLYGWSKDCECLDVLDDRIETYAIPVLSGDKRRALLSRPVGEDTYIYLGLSTDAKYREQVYRLACIEHGLKSPSRSQKR